MRAKTLKRYANRIQDLSREMREQSWIGETTYEEDIAGERALDLIEALVLKLHSLADHALAETR